MTKREAFMKWFKVNFQVDIHDDSLEEIFNWFEAKAPSDEEIVKATDEYMRGAFIGDKREWIRRTFEIGYRACRDKMTGKGE